MYTVALSGELVSKREITLVFQTLDGEKQNSGKTDATGIASMWGPWSSAVQVLVDGEKCVDRAEWRERPADRYTEVLSG